MPNNIPKVVYQTWYSKELHENVAQLRQQMIEHNPDYKFILYDDADIEDFIATYSDDLDDNEELMAVYKSLAVGAARADLWRYMVLYKYGGVYLDMDAYFIGKIDEIILSVYIRAELAGGTIYPLNGLLTREANVGVFNNWVLMFAPGHPFMYEMVNYCFHQIRGRITNDILSLTGPLALSHVLHDFATNGEVVDLYAMSDEEFNRRYSNGGTQLTLYGIDMNSRALCKHPVMETYLYDSKCAHWRSQMVALNNKLFVDSWEK